MIHLLIGGARAGKSSRALAIAESAGRGRPMLFVATAQPLDDEMRLRIDAHRRERPSHWRTLESPLDVPEDVAHRLATEPNVYAAIVIDCLTLWVSNLLLSWPESADAESLAAKRAGDLARVLRIAADGRIAVAVVTNEVGLGIVPGTALGRRYRDALGRANQLLAAVADEVSLMVAGVELRLK